jgi:hypothetical protein
MAHWKDRLTNGALNAALVVCGLAALVLLYGLVSRSFTTPPESKRASNPGHLVGDVIQVEVRNGCGVDQLAARTTEYLRAQGFDVVAVGNQAPFDQEETVVIDRVGDLASARRVAEALGLPESRVKQDVQRSYYLDASIIIGRDYRRLPPFRNDS